MLEKNKCPYCGEEILISATICKNCWLPRERFGTYEELKKKIKEFPDDCVPLDELCEIYQQLRKIKHRGREKENIEQFPAYYEESIGKEVEKAYCLSNINDREDNPSCTLIQSHQKFE